MNIFKLIVGFFRRNEPALSVDASVQELYALFGYADVTIVKGLSSYAVTANLPKALNQGELNTISVTDFKNLLHGNYRTRGELTASEEAPRFGWASWAIHGLFKKLTDCGDAS
jgi:hypothetical protein